MTISLLLLGQDRQISTAPRGERIDPRDISSVAEQLQNAHHPCAATLNRRSLVCRAGLK